MSFSLPRFSEFLSGVVSPRSSLKPRFEYFLFPDVKRRIVDPALSTGVGHPGAAFCMV